MTNILHSKEIPKDCLAKYFITQLIFNLIPDLITPAIQDQYSPYNINYKLTNLNSLLTNIPIIKFSIPNTIKEIIETSLKSILIPVCKHLCGRYIPRVFVISPYDIISK